MIRPYERYKYFCYRVIYLKNTQITVRNFTIIMLLIQGVDAPVMN